MSRLTLTLALMLLANVALRLARRLSSSSTSSKFQLRP